VRYVPSLLIILALTGCAALNMGWYKPGVTQQQFSQDKYACMSSSQMQYSQSTVQGTGGTYNGGGSTTCNVWGNTVNCNGDGGYSTPGSVNGQSSSGVTTNMPLFQACMQSRGYVWTSQAQVQRYEASQAPPPSPAQTYSSSQSSVQSEKCTAAQIRSGNCN
jgi:hypothetical protein